ncbi:queuosine-tRNA galactosyltransferase-like isoform X1 [Centruroides vittatus]|uniref:queuosine-tRNA galactosyltransferase-like isoform X1 n=2 Tax=Centruroides vittatus TaxID=120091 RepID=UPI00350E99C6
MNCVDVSIILPVHNAEKWFDECLASVANQKFNGKLELSVYFDASMDNSQDILKSWLDKLQKENIKVVISEGKSSISKGVGYAKNRAVEQSNGEYLCFLDADDVMHPSRIQKQYESASKNKDAIIGSKFNRFPVGSTKRFTDWANNLNNKQLYTQIYTSHGPTLIMPTWFCSREVFKKVGGFSEAGMGTPEDLLFYFAHLKLHGSLYRVDEDLLMYRYHPGATTFSIDEKTIWDIRIKELEEHVLCHWPKFTIWNAGKQGRKFFRSISTSNRSKIVAFCDVDRKKISKGFYTFEESEDLVKPKIPIIHFTQAKPPFIICVKLDLTGGNFEENLSSLNLTEGIDYFLFS